MKGISFYSDELIIGGFFLLIAIFLRSIILNAIRHKKVALRLQPSRELNQSDLDAIEFLDIKGNLSVNLFLNPKLPKKEIYKKIWQFSNVDFLISIRRMHKRIDHHFFLNIDGDTIEVIVPEIFLPYLKEGHYYQNKTIELLYRVDQFVLYSIDGVISYPTLYEKFKLEQANLAASNALRRATKEELEAFSFSKYSSTWGLIFPCLFPFSILAIMNEGIGISIVFLPFLLFVMIPFYIAYKKRKNYIATRNVYRLEGKLWFDEEKYVYRINQDELKLHPKWLKLIQRMNLPINSVKMEAFLHTFDNLDHVVCRKFQPIALQSAELNINESNLKSTRSCLISGLYLSAFGAIAFLAPKYANSENVIFNPIHLLSISDNHVFVLLMTGIWWVSVVISIYLAYLTIHRFCQSYFYVEVCFS